MPRRFLVAALNDLQLPEPTAHVFSCLLGFLDY